MTQNTEQTNAAQTAQTGSTPAPEPRLMTPADKHKPPLLRDTAPKPVTYSDFASI